MINKLVRICFFVNEMRSALFDCFESVPGLCVHREALRRQKVEQPLWKLRVWLSESGGCTVSQFCFDSDLILVLVTLLV